MGLLPFLILVVIPLFMGAVWLLHSFARNGAGPWVGLGFITLGAGMLFLSYAVEGAMWGLKRSDGFSLFFGIKGSVNVILGLIMLGSPARNPDATPDRAGWPSRRFIIGSLVAVLVFVLLFRFFPSPPQAASTSHRAIPVKVP